MASNDDMGELRPQEPGVPGIFGQHAVKKEPTDDHNASLSTMEHLPPGNPEPEHDTAVKVEKRQDERESTMDIQNVTASAQDETSDSRQNPAVPQEELPGITSGRTEYTTVGSQVPTQATQDEHVDTLALDAPSAHAANMNETSHAAIPESGQKDRTGRNAQTTPLDSAMQNDELLVGTSEALRGGPHMLSDSVAVYNQERQEKEVDMGEAQTVDEPEDAAMSDNTDTWANDQSEDEGNPQPGRRPESSGQANPVRRTKRSRDEASDGSDHEGEGEISMMILRMNRVLRRMVIRMSKMNTNWRWQHCGLRFLRLNWLCSNNRSLAKVVQAFRTARTTVVASPGYTVMMGLASMAIIQPCSTVHTILVLFIQHTDLATLPFKFSSKVCHTDRPSSQ
jgi:hypothetical protein